MPEKERKPLILFAISGSTEDESAELLSRIKKLGGYVLTGDISSVRHNIRRKRHYYLLDFDGSINLENGLRLFEKYNDAASDTLYMWLYTKDETASVIERVERVAPRKFSNDILKLFSNFCHNSYNPFDPFEWL